MFVDHLQLVDFRSYAGVDVALGAGVVVFVGANGQGKTNLVEAVEYLSTLSSHRVASDVPLVRAGAERAIARARVQAGLDDPRQLQLEVEITRGKANRARLNRSPVKRAREIVGVLRTVVFSPGGPGGGQGRPERAAAVPRRPRRRPAGRGWPGCGPTTTGCCGSATPCSSRSSGRSRGGPPGRGRRGRRSTCGTRTWPQAGAELVEARLTTLSDVVPHLAKAYADIAPTNSEATAEYVSAVRVRARAPTATSSRRR